jgi:hypothetical protein
MKPPRYEYPDNPEVPMQVGQFLSLYAGPMTANAAKREQKRIVDAGGVQLDIEMTDGSVFEVEPREVTLGPSPQGIWVRVYGRLGQRYTPSEMPKKVSTSEELVLARTVVIAEARELWRIRSSGMHGGFEGTLERLGRALIGLENAEQAAVHHIEMKEGVPS